MTRTLSPSRSASACTRSRRSSVTGRICPPGNRRRRPARDRWGRPSPARSGTRPTRKRVISPLDEPSPAGGFEIGQRVHTGVAERVDASGQPAGGKERRLAVVDRGGQLARAGSGSGPVAFGLNRGRRVIGPTTSGRSPTMARALRTVSGWAASDSVSRGVVERMDLRIEGVADHVHSGERQRGAVELGEIGAACHRPRASRYQLLGTPRAPRR